MAENVLCSITNGLEKMSSLCHVNSVELKKKEIVEMPKKRKLVDASKKCRFCLNDEGNLTNIFTEELLPKIDELVKSTSIHILDVQGLPQNICHVCLYKLELWFDFKEQFIHSNKIFHQYISNHELSENIASTGENKCDTGLKLACDVHNKKDTEKHGTELYKIPKLSETGDERRESVKFESKPHIITKFIEVPEKLQKIDQVSEVSLFDQMECQTQLKSPKTRCATGRRTNEQRKASTQRWAARKKALLDAAGQNESDTDSVISSDSQLLSVQKAKDTTKLENLINPINQGQFLKNGIIEDSSNVEEFEPQTMHSELKIDNAHFIVTSILDLFERHNLVQKSNNLCSPPMVKKICNENIKHPPELPQAPTIPDKNEKTFVKHCLNIEVNGCDIKALQKVQSSLAHFVKTDMQQRLAKSSTRDSRNNSYQSQSSFQILEEQLKTIVEKAIQKNLEMNMKPVPFSEMNASRCRRSENFSSAFIKAAMTSRIFQPKVRLNRAEGNSSLNSNLFVLQKQNETTCQMVTRTDKVTENALQTIEPLNDCQEINVDNNKMNCDHDEYICEDCGAKFASKTKFEIHHLSHQSTQSTVKDNIQKEQKKMRCKKYHAVAKASSVKSQISQSAKYKQKHCNGISGKNSVPQKTLEFDSNKDLDHDDQKSKLNEEEIKTNRVNTCQDQEPTWHICPQCSEIFQSEINLALHIQAHEEEAAIAEWEEQGLNVNGSYRCSICVETFASEKDLTDHLSIHNNTSHVCILCDESYSSLLELQMHVNTH